MSAILYVKKLIREKHSLNDFIMHTYFYLITAITMIIAGSYIDKSKSFLLTNVWFIGLCHITEILVFLLLGLLIIESLQSFGIWEPNEKKP
jgi:hypothetical protein